VTTWKIEPHVHSAARALPGCHPSIKNVRRIEMVWNTRKSMQIALVGLGILAGAIVTSPAGHAGGAAILVPAEDRDVPQGSQIPERRIRELERKVEAYKEMMRRRNTEEQQEKIEGSSPLKRR
jgi:hypothetical protein